MTNVCKAWEDQRNEGRMEGRAEGRVEGRLEGRVEERKSMIKRMLSKNKTPEEIADLCGYEMAEIEEVEKEMCVLV